MKTKGTRTKIALVIVLICWLIPSSLCAMIRCVDGIWYDALIYEGIASVVACVDNENLGVGPKTYEGDIVIPDSFNVGGNEYRVMGIDEGAFSGCTGLTSVTIPSVEWIGSDAFSGCTSLASITIPNGVTTISSSAFSGCTSLTSVTIPSSVTNIQSYAFQGCTSLASVTIPSSVTDIGYSAFECCISLASVTIPSSVTTISSSAFSGCTGLTSVTIHNGVTEISCETFYGCTSLTSVTIPSSVTIIGASAFENTAWYNNQPDGLVYAGNVAYQYKGEMPEGTLITIRNGTVSISENAFSRCTSLTSVTIPSSVTTIGGGAFYGCTSLSSVTIPSSVTTISSSAFSRCTSLTSVTIPSSVTTIGGGAFSDCTNLTSVSIPSSVTFIGRSAFSGCTGLTSVTIPNSVTYIDDSAFDCSNLLSIYVEGETPPSILPDVTEYWSDENGSFQSVDKKTCVLYVPKGCKSAYENAEGWKDFQNIEEVLVTGSCGDNVTYTIYSDMTMDISGTGAMTDYAGYYDDLVDKIIVIDRENNDYWTQVKTVKIQEGVTSIGAYAFAYCEELTSLTIPSSVTEIGENAFKGCTSLSSVTIPSSVTSIGSSAFSGCSGLASVTIPSSVTSIGGYTFEDCTSLASVSIPSSVTKIQTCTFLDCASLASLTIPSSVTEIEWGAFQNCTSLASLTIPSSVTIIGASAFENSAWYNNQPDGLVYAGNVAYQYKGEMPEGTSITIRNGTVSISENAFYECGGLTSVMIPSSVTWIGHVAFSGCSGLTSVTIPSSVTAIGFSAFSRCTGLTSVTIPNGVTEISEETFYGCTSLASVTLSEGVTVIGDEAFEGCTSLTSVTIPNSVTWIGERAFSCPNLLSIYVKGETPAHICTLVDDWGRETFNAVDKSACVLYVPNGCKSAYENAEGWKEFQNIVEVGEEPATDISTLDNAIYVEQTDGRIGGTMDIPVKLKNSYPVRGFQFYLELPEGTTINGWELSMSRMPEGATLSDMIATKKIDGNKIQVACSLNYGDATFTGNDGEIATVNVTFSEGMEEGTYPIYLTACDLTTAGGIDEDLSDVTSTLVLEDYIVGDANGDGKIRIGDATTILNYIVGTASDNFNEKAADANGDGKIRIGDATTILNIIVNQ